MNISDILKRKGMFSKDIRIRLKNGQIKLNGETIKEDVVITHFTTDMLDEDENLFDSIVMDAGDFLFWHICKNSIWEMQCNIFGIEELFDSNITNDLTKFLSGFCILRLSKKEILIIKT